ncbi:MAG: glycosyltransferase, partial [Ignavibacteriaceae bacterium]
AINIYKELLAIKPDTCMFIIGDGEKITDLKNVAKQYILKDCIFFTGYLENADEYLKYFDLLLITSDREGMPFIIWEAMGNSTPVVSSNVGGIKEILEIYDCGYVFEKDDLSGAVGKISLLLTDESLRKNLAESGLRIVDEKFNSKNFIRKIEQVYFNLLNR